MKFTVLFEREVHTRETVTREIEAANYDAACDQASDTCSVFENQPPADRVQDAAPCETCMWNFTVDSGK